MASEPEKYDLEAMLREIEEDEGKTKNEKPKAVSQADIMKMLKQKKGKSQ